MFDEAENMFFSNVDFKNIDITNIEKYLTFMEDSGLLDFFQNNENRSGTTMELIVEREVTKVCKQLGFEYQNQATAKWMDKAWGIHVPIDKSARRFDMAVFDRDKYRVYVIEANFYGGGGSKLKSVWRICQPKSVDKDI